MTRTMRLALPALLLAAAGSVASAQGATADAATTKTETPAVNTAPVTAPEVKAVNSGPTAASATVGVKRSTDPAPAPAPRFAETRQNQALMIVGFGALIAGAVIGGDAGTIIMIGGAGVGLYGLYKYLE